MKNSSPILETINRFVIRTTVIFAVFLVITGVYTVRQRAREVTGETSYSAAYLIDNENEIGLRLGEKRLTVSRQTVRKLEHYVRSLRTLTEHFG